MRTALVIALESPDPSLPRSYSFEYGFPRTALLIASCIQEWGKKVGLTPKVLNLDIKIRQTWEKFGRIKDDRNILDEVLFKEISIHDPDLVCIVAPYTNIANWAIRAARVCKSVKPETLIITGGPHASFLSKDLVNSADPIFDAVILGPGEAKLKHLLEYFDDPTRRFRFDGISTPQEPVDFSPSAQLNNVQIPAIDYGLISKDEIGTAGTVVMAGRGCLNACQFCLESLYWRRAAIPFYKTASRVRNEIVALSQLGVPVFGCGDSLIDMRSQTLHFELFCQEAFAGLPLNENFFILTRVNMIDTKGCQVFHQAGGKALLVGIETASEDLLVAMGKGEVPYILELQLSKAKQSGLCIGAFFMFGFPGETSDSAQKTLDLIENLFKKKLLDYIDPSVFVPYPGLPFFEDQERIIRHEPEWSDWDRWGRYNEPPIYDLISLSRNEIFRYWNEALALNRKYDLREKVRAVGD